MKWLRPSGILGFAAVIALLAVFWWLFAGLLIKAGVEGVGSRVVGAKVELQDAALSLSPFGVRLSGLRVTNPEQPMQNLLQLDQAHGDIELAKLLMGQVIINDLSASGLRFNTPRKTSGALPKRAAAEKSTAGKPGIDLQAARDKLPSVDDILAREPLTTLSKAKALKQSTAEHKQAVAEAVAALPDQAQLKAYEQRINALTSGKIASVDDLQKRQAELKQLKADMANDKQAIEQARLTIRDARQSLTRQYDELKQAPAADLAMIRSRYGLDAGGAGNLSALLFGDTAKEWLELLRTWYGRLQGFLPESEETPPAVKPARGEGRFIHFAAAEPLPDFLIRHAGITAQLPIGDIGITLSDITHQPQLLGRPMRLHATGEKLKGAQSLSVDGVFDHVRPQAASDRLDWTLKGWQLADVELSGSDSLALALQQARVNLAGDATLRQGKLAANVDAAFSAAKWRSNAKQGWAEEVGKTIAAIDQFSVVGKLAGDIQAPDISLKSDLDRRIKQAATARLESKQTELEDKLRARLDSEIASVAGPYKEQLALLTQSEGSLDQRVKQLEKMLKTELQSAVDTQKEKAQQRLEDKLKGGLKGLGF